jgi:hypothetical protein
MAGSRRGVIAMPATVRSEGGNCYRVDVNGLLRKSEMEKAQATLLQEIAHAGKVRLLFVLRDFKGWEKGPDWGDLRFYEAHGQSLERMAIVGEERWRDEAMMFALADLRKAPTRYFLPEQIDGARVWLAQDF